MIPNEEIIRRIKEGDIEVFNSLFKSYYMPLYFSCRKFIASPEEAKDLLQNVFLRFWEKRMEIDIHTSLKAYLYRSVQNECLNYLRSVPSYVGEGNTSGNIGTEVSDMYATPDTVLATVEIEQIIENTIKQFPPQCKTIFILSRLKGLKNQQIAQKLNISVRTVDTQIYRALKILKVRLKDYLAFY
ncbi:RNA polymerase sigma-70 factor [Parabacteroides pacaensis]|uniref:RNA polymerase sigma-70 factor n=1 Tax=Parabacteroides pacaensis TaxID=2086575 RepID=UPI000D11424E|nr:RNA polymerase sigma-70 factor [Parabacteroides pacaensis]